MLDSRFKPYLQHQSCLLPQDLGEMIAPDHLVRVVDAIIEAIDLSDLYASYTGGGASAHDPKMMLKVVAYAYASGIYSSRAIARATAENIHFLWLTGQTMLDHMTINRFRGERLAGTFEDIFSEVIYLIANAGYLTLDTYFLDGTKIEAAANKYSFVWRGSTEKYQQKLREKVHEHLREIDRLNDEEDAFYDSLPEAEAITADDIAAAAERINEKLKNKPADKELKKAKKAFEGDYLPRARRYEEQIEVLEQRNSYSRTDTDATFMRMKEDHMRNGQLKAAYNIQMGTENQFIVGYTLHRRAGDTACMSDHLNHLNKKIGHIPKRIVADAGYGSEENYVYLEEKGCEAYVKYHTFHQEHKPRFNKDPVQAANWRYDKEADTYTCAQGRKLEFIRKRTDKSDRGFISTVHIYGCADCRGCPHQRRCTKSDDPDRARRIYITPQAVTYRKQAAELLTSEEGIDLRRRRATDVETVFGNIKNNYHFKRFSLRGLTRTTLEFGLVALGHNLRKLAMQGA